MLSLERTFSACCQPSLCGFPAVLGQSAQTQAQSPTAKHKAHKNLFRMQMPLPPEIRSQMASLAITLQAVSTECDDTTPRRRNSKRMSFLYRNMAMEIRVTTERINFLGLHSGRWLLGYVRYIFRRHAVLQKGSVMWHFKSRTYFASEMGLAIIAAAPLYLRGQTANS